MGRTKVLHIIGGGEFGGAEQHLLTLMRHVNPAEFELHAACFFSGPLAPLVVNEGFPAHVFPMQSKFDLSPINEIASLIRREGFSIVHTHGVRANLIGRLAARRAGVSRVVTTVHSVLHFDYPRRLDRFVNTLCENLTRRFTSRFIAVSEMLREQLVREGIPGDRITTVYNGLELGQYNPLLSGQTVREELGLSPDQTVAGIIARLHPVKGHDSLLEAMARVAPDFPDLALLVVGSGLERQRLEQAAEGLGIKDKVIFTGFRSDVPEVIAALDFLVLSSQSEGLGLIVMEAMAMQKPVLATRVGGIPEVVTSGQDGLLVPPGDSEALAQGIKTLVGNRELASQLAAAARLTIEAKFTAEKMGADTAALYQKMTETGSGLNI
ncbi:glycosyltransferase [Phosphitispora fastidiosa]|uniref:glycosyltransferase n=1 Tax=Phosphitispora fastidiosa TaxID=2837202 RepID=UPI001E342422|nr:glycosyltransferase [Phosphitispora fastidiosa]MBU7008216.1 glycosyltransferase involved in cell wall biosynthesis [Phosphitispora fastidiosa]